MRPPRVRLVVAGGRDFDDREFVFRALESLHRNVYEVAVLIHGGASGADTYAGAWARERGIPVEVYEADWEAHKAAAGPIRNRKMMTDGEPDVMVAFPGGAGTEDAIRVARKSGIEVRCYEPVYDDPRQTSILDCC